MCEKLFYNRYTSLNKIRIYYTYVSHTYTKYRNTILIFFLYLKLFDRTAKYSFLDFRSVLYPFRRNVCLQQKTNVNARHKTDVRVSHLREYEAYLLSRICIILDFNYGVCTY